MAFQCTFRWQETPVFPHVSLLQLWYYYMRRQRENCGKTRDLSKIWYMPDPWFRYSKAWDRLLQSPPVSQKHPFQEVAYQRLTENAPYCNPGSSMAVGPSSLQPLALCSLTAAGDFEGREWSHTLTAMKAGLKTKERVCSFLTEHWSELPCPSSRDLPDPGIEPTSLMSSAFTGEFFTKSATWEDLDWEK